VAGVSFVRTGRSDGRLNLGDTFAMIPPFTGNGMAMAFQCAELALDPLLAWTRGERAWADSVGAVNTALRKKFARRLAAAETAHPFLFSTKRQRWLAAVARMGIVPLRPLYHLLH
jgi:flavin-dependent dehydrogenase